MCRKEVLRVATRERLEIGKKSWSLTVQRGRIKDGQADWSEDEKKRRTTVTEGLVKVMHYGDALSLSVFRSSKF